MNLSATNQIKANPYLPFGDKQDGLFYGKDILSVRQFSRKDFDYIFGVAGEMQEMVRRVGSFDLLKGKILANLFYEPSTRTSSSFTAAMERLGGSVIPINEVKYSSVSKGESLPDTVRTLEAYADVIVLRHPEVGSAELAARYARKPIINAGDGVGEHPTQALLDLFTIQQELGQVDGLTITLVGDLKYGRTVHSLARLLMLFNVRLNYVSPELLRMPFEVLEEVSHAKNILQVELDNLDNVISETDVLYVTRVQKERFTDPELYERVKRAYVISPETLRGAKQKMISLCIHCRGWERSLLKLMVIHGQLISARWNTDYMFAWHYWRSSWEKRESET